jgi:hypothetical protein
MTSRGAGDLKLAADLAGSGAFVHIGTMLEPGPQFAASIRDLRNGQVNTGLHEVLIYAAAAVPAGNCIFHDKQIEKALRDCFEARLISEWRITFPGLGMLRALYIVKRLHAGNDAGFCNLELQLASKPVFYFFPPEGPESR